MEVIIPLHIEGDKLFFPEVRLKIRLYTYHMYFCDFEFSLDFFFQSFYYEDNWKGYIHDSYMPALLTETKWVKNANITFCFNAKMENNISNYLTNGSCLNCRILNWYLSRGSHYL